MELHNSTMANFIFFSVIFFSLSWFSFLFAAASPPPSVLYSGGSLPATILPPPSFPYSGGSLPATKLPQPTPANTDSNGYTANMSPTPPAFNYPFEPLAALPPPTSDDSPVSHILPLHLEMTIVGGVVLCSIILCVVAIKCSQPRDSKEASKYGTKSRDKPETQSPNIADQLPIDDRRSLTIPETTVSVPNHCPSCGHGPLHVYRAVYVHCPSCGFGDLGLPILSPELYPYFN